MNLEQKFPESIHPGNDSLLRTGCYDDSDIEFLYKHEGEAWKNIDSDELSIKWECLFFLTVEGILYVLPKFLEMLTERHDRCLEWLDSFPKVVDKQLRSTISEDQKHTIQLVIDKYNIG
jgi:hypothetical protein